MHAFRDGAPAAHEVGNAENIRHRRLAAHQRRIGLGRLGHLGRAGAAAIAADIHAPHIEATACDVIHPGEAAERQVKGRMRRIGRAMHHDERATGREARHALRPLVAHEDLNASIARRHHEFLGDDARRLGLGLNRDQRRGEGGGSEQDTALHAEFSLGVGGRLAKPAKLREGELNSSMRARRGADHRW